MKPLKLDLSCLFDTRLVVGQDDTPQIEMGIAVYVVDGGTIDVQLGRFWKLLL